MWKTAETRINTAMGQLYFTVSFCPIDSDQFSWLRSRVFGVLVTLL